jgi:hypothetical protein
MSEKTINNVGQMSEYMKEDGQTMRGVLTYLQSTYEDVEGHEFEFDKMVFNNQLEFFEFVRDVCNYQVNSIKDE